MLAVEYDAQGRPLAEWRLGPDGNDVVFAQTPAARITHTRAAPAMRCLAEAFLPAGFPDSVTADYLAFNIWDTTQVISCDPKCMEPCMMSFVSYTDCGKTAHCPTPRSCTWHIVSAGHLLVYPRHVDIASHPGWRRLRPQGMYPSLDALTLILYTDLRTVPHLRFRVAHQRSLVCVRGRDLTVISTLPQEATSLGAVFQFFLRDMMGMVGGVVFASVQGSSFDAYAKQWRLFADCLNNVGVPSPAAADVDACTLYMISRLVHGAGLALELLSPAVPSLFLPLASLGSVARSITGDKTHEHLSHVSLTDAELPGC